jgi:secreted PhoX family phosphatase
MSRTHRHVDRREFLRETVAAAGVAAAAMPALTGLSILGLNGRVSAARGRGGYGPLFPTPDHRDGVERIALPEGFEYRSFSTAGEVMSDGNLVPLAHDGMGVFNMPEGKFRLVRNHEDRNGGGRGTTAVESGMSYDMRAGGGTTTLVVNPFTRQLEEHFISVSGTTVNCAGGITPWDSWVTCEETNVGPTTTVNPPNLPWLRQHGYSFDVPAAANGQVPAVPILDMGRFSHEALAVDPRTWIVYETEDTSGSSGFYRFIPNTPGQLAAGGQLQMLAIEDRFQYDARTGQTVGVALPVTWVDIANPNPAGTSSTAVFNQGRALGGVRFNRLEGCWYGNGAIYFDDTSGGNAGDGQVWEFRPEGDGGTLTLIFESPGPSVLDSPDNLAVSPQGAILLCEDGGGDQYMRGVTLDGQIFDFALNLSNDSEWAGATFAEADPAWNDRKIRGDNPPLGGRWDRVTLFVNRQGATDGPTPPTQALNRGMTFAIWGPWGEGAL